jgi:hypothetical protein
MTSGCLIIGRMTTRSARHKNLWRHQMVLSFISPSSMATSNRPHRPTRETVADAWRWLRQNAAASPQHFRDCS